jgi:hypothetical protein
MTPAKSDADAIRMSNVQSEEEREMIPTLKGIPTVQIAYVVPDAREAARRHSAIFGSGPYFYIDLIRLRFARWNGKETVYNHGSAFGQFGDIMIELMEPRDLHDVNVLGLDSRPTSPVFHHQAFAVEKAAEMVADLGQQGYELGLHVMLESNIEAFMVDARRDCGHFIELFTPSPLTLQFYDTVKSASIGWDGSDLIRTIAI